MISSYTNTMNNSTPDIKYSELFYKNMLKEIFTYKEFRLLVENIYIKVNQIKDYKNKSNNISINYDNITRNFIRRIHNFMNKINLKKPNSKIINMDIDVEEEEEVNKSYNELIINKRNININRNSNKDIQLESLEIDTDTTNNTNNQNYYSSSELRTIPIENKEDDLENLEDLEIENLEEDITDNIPNNIRDTENITDIIEEETINLIELNNDSIISLNKNTGNFKPNTSKNSNKPNGNISFIEYLKSFNSPIYVCKGKHSFHIEYNIDDNGIYMYEIQSNSSLSKSISYNLNCKKIKLYPIKKTSNKSSYKLFIDKYQCVCISNCFMRVYFLRRKQEVIINEANTNKKSRCKIFSNSYD